MEAGGKNKLYYLILKHSAFIEGEGIQFLIEKAQKRSVGGTNMS